MIRIFMQMNITVHYLCVLQDPVRLLPQHGLVHAHPRHGHVQRDPYLRHDKWHLLQVRHELSHSRYPLPHLPSSILAWKMHAFLQNFENSIHIHPSAGQSQPPITTVCPVTFPMPQFGFNGWVSMLKSILGSLCHEYHYVSLPRIPSRQQSLFGCGWLGSSTPIPPLLRVLFVYRARRLLSDSGVSDYCLTARPWEGWQTRCSCSGHGCSVSSHLSLDDLASSRSSTWALSIPQIKHFYLMHTENPAFYPLCAARAQQELKYRHMAERSDNSTSTEDFMIQWGS